MSKPTLILIGAGGHANSCIDLIEQHSRYQIVGLVGMPEEVNTCRLGYPVIASDDSLPQLVKKYEYALITVGHIRSSERRIRIYERVAELGFKLPIVISPFAHVSRHATFGAGTIVMHGAIVNAGSKVGINCIINSRALLEHDSIVEDHCHISTGAILNGGVHVGVGSFVGSGSIIKEGIILGKNCVVGMGLSVRRNQTNDSQFVGNINK